ncbi:MAG TPA: glycosyltransferase [Acidimicrobiales bacterium]|nr:glycosyltransferase [Acidimicrobiales bacterium]
MTDTETAGLVTVVVPARNEERYIRRALEEIRLQSYAALEILVVDGGSDDRTREIVAEQATADPRIRLIDNPRKVIPAGQNLALESARGAWLVTIGAHSTVNRDYIAIAVGHLRSGGWGAVGGRVCTYGETRFGNAVTCAMGSWAGVGGARYDYSEQAQAIEHVPFPAYPTELIRRLGGWNERLIANSDVELNWRVGQTGRKLLYEPRMEIRYRGSQTPRELARQYRRYGRGKGTMAVIDPRSPRPRHFAPVALVLWVTLALTTGRRRPRAAALKLLPYTVGSIGAGMRAGRRLPWRERLLVPYALWLMHICYGFGTLEGLARGLLTGAWARRLRKPASTVPR